jgi:hypothetical protein
LAVHLVVVAEVVGASPLDPGITVSTNVVVVVEVEVVEVVEAAATMVVVAEEEVTMATLEGVGEAGLDHLEPEAMAAITPAAVIAPMWIGSTIRIFELLGSSPVCGGWTFSGTNLHNAKTLLYSPSFS